MKRDRTTQTETVRVNLSEIRDRGTINVYPEAAAVLGVGRNLAYAMAKRGDLPTIRLGSRVVVPVPALLAMLGERP